jgi:hypothetical protein
MFYLVCNILLLYLEQIFWSINNKRRIQQCPRFVKGAVIRLHGPIFTPYCLHAVQTVFWYAVYHIPGLCCFHEYQCEQLKATQHINTQTSLNSAANFVCPASTMYGTLLVRRVLFLNAWYCLPYKAILPQICTWRALRSPVRRSIGQEEFSQL